MNLRQRLFAELQRYDDEAFVALANRGLLRRAGKDLDTITPAVVDENNDALVIAVGDLRVRFDAKGLVGARCSCPAGGVCQHILSVGLWLQRQTGGPDGDASAVQGAPDEPATQAGGAPAKHDESIETLHAALMAFDAPALHKYAGKSGYRWAWQFVLDLEPERGVRIGGERNVTIAFQHPSLTFRYVGGGLDNLIADAGIGKIEKYRVAAVLAYQRAHGVEPMPPEPASQPHAAMLDLGKDHALPESVDQAQLASRARLRGSVRQLLVDCMDFGLAHLSSGIHERFATLAVWAQGAEYHRLAMVLRRLADHVDLLLERAGGADEHRLFEEATLAFALVHALETAEASGNVPIQLLGRARNTYTTVPALELLGLGALPWRTASGYIGLTMLFWSPGEQTFLSCGEARPERQRAGFDPISRYRLAGPWSGLGTPAEATGRRVVLRDAQMSALGRLSTSDRTHATVNPAPATEFIQQLAPHQDWQSLQEGRAGTRQSLLAEQHPMGDWVVLAPARFGSARFQATRQVLMWPLLDLSGNKLMAEIPFSDYNRPAIERLEGQAATPLGTLVVARLRDTASGLVAEPLSLIYRNVPPGAPAVDALYFDTAPQQGALSKAVGTIRRLAATSAGAIPGGVSGAPGDIPALVAFRAWLVRLAERGVGGTLTGQGVDAFDSRIAELRKMGLTSFAHGSRTEPFAASLLRAHYVVMQYARLLGHEDEPDDAVAG